MLTQGAESNHIERRGGREGLNQHIFTCTVFYLLLGLLEEQILFDIDIAFKMQKKSSEGQKRFFPETDHQNDGWGN